MKTTSMITLAAVSTLLFGFIADNVKTLTVKPEASKVEWFAEKVTGKHNGTVALKSGQIELDGKTIVGGTFSMDMATINTLDLEGEYKGKLDRHLKSADFFDVDNHAIATFKIKKTAPISGVEGFNTEVTGDLTLKGITHEISFPAKIEVKDDKLAAYGEMIIDRTKYDIKYGSTSFFDSLGDKAIMNDFTMKISIGAKI